MASGSQDGHPCVPYVRAVILHLGNIMGTLPKLILMVYRFLCRGYPPQKFLFPIRIFGGDGHAYIGPPSCSHNEEEDGAWKKLALKVVS